MALSLPGIPDDLGQALRRAPGHLHAVIDGSRFRNLPGRLAAVGLDAVPLHTDEVDMPDLRQGAYLVACRTGYAMEQVRDVQAGTATVVWWCWSHAGQAADARLIAHLRRLALVDVPVGQRDRMIGAPWQDAMVGGEPTEPVLFRHADPDVIAALLPVLGPEQRARVFGDALAILTETADGHLVQATAPRTALGGQRAAYGRLRLDAAQYAALGTVYRAALRRRALQEFAPVMALLDPVDPGTRLMAAFDRAEGYGLDSKAAIWEFLTLETRHGPTFELGEGRGEVLRELARSDLPADERIWRAELALQAARGEDWTPVSGTRQFVPDRHGAG